MLLDCGCSDVVEKLIEHKGDVNGTHGLLRDSLLHTAIKMRRSEIVMLLLQKGACVNARNAFWYTPLHQITDGWGSEVRIVQALLDNKADVTIKDQYERTPLQLRSQRGYENGKRLWRRCRCECSR